MVYRELPAQLVLKVYRVSLGLPARKVTKAILVIQECKAFPVRKAIEAIEV